MENSSVGINEGLREPGLTWNCWVGGGCGEEALEALLVGVHT